MRQTAKPVRRCRACSLNMGKTCWKFVCPRKQWERRKCPGFENSALYVQFQHWMEAPRVKSARQLRRELFRSKPNGGRTTLPKSA